MVRQKRIEGPETSFTLKFSAEERALLGQLVEARARELRDAAGIDVPVSIASYLRWLVLRDAQARGLTLAAPPAEKSRRKSER